MRHGIETIVITNTEQCDAMLERLNAERDAAQADDFAAEKAKPIKMLDCTCCGSGLMGREWWNQEPGYGLCDDCVSLCIGGNIPAGTETDTYGVSGIHFQVPQADRDNPPLCVNRGVPLYGLDERLRIEGDGYVFWKGLRVEHFSGSMLTDTTENKIQACEMIRKCEAIENRGEVVSFVAMFVEE